MKAGVNPGMEVDILIKNIITNAVIPTLVAIAVGSIIYAGVLYMTSQGNPDKIKKAKAALLWPVIGIILIVMSISILVVLNSVVKNKII